MIQNSTMALLGAATLISVETVHATQTSTSPVVGEVMVSGSSNPLLNQVAVVVQVSLKM